jgi:hypothetical protein
VIRSTRRILSGLAGFALLAMPVGAAAGTSPVGFPPVSVVQRMPPAAWTDVQFNEYKTPPPRLWYVHHESDNDDYPAQVCDEDGDNCRQSYQESPAQYQDYGRQYGAPPYYDGRPDLLSERQRLVRQLDEAQHQFLAARDAGDRKMSARWAHHIKKLNHRLAALDAQAADAASNFHPPISSYPYAGNPPATYPPAGYPYAPGYSANPNGASPNGTSGLGGMINSLLGRTGSPPAGAPPSGYPSAGYPPPGPPPAGSPYAPGYSANPNGASPNGTSGLSGMINSLLGPSAGSLPPGSPPAGSPYAPGYGANPNGTSAPGGMMNSLLGSFMGKGTAP